MDQGRKKIAPTRGDIGLIVGCLLAALICCGLWLGLRRDGAAVVVEQDEGGEVWLSEADCPNLLCVKTGKIRYAGQSIVCLPHKVAVRIVGGASALDAVTGP